MSDVQQEINNTKIPEDKRVRLSASKLESLKQCSWRFYCRYFLKLPDSSNDGAKRGTICHLVLEVLLNKRHRKYIDQIIQNKSPRFTPSIDRLIRKHAKILGVDSEENIEMMYSMIVVGLSHSFIIPDEIGKISAEEEFRIENEKFIAIGYIDKTFFMKDRIIIWDYKTSKSRFTDQEAEEKDQSLLYSLHTYKKHGIVPEIKYLFLRFPKKTLKEVPKFDIDTLEGYEYYLETIAEKLASFDVEEAMSCMAADNLEKRWLCGGSGKDNRYCCPYKNPLTYYAIKKGDEVIKTSYEKSELIPKEGERVVKMQYSGCPAFNIPVE